MAKYLYSILLLISTNSFSQNIFKVQILSVVDSLPISGLNIKIGKINLIKTDSTGFFQISADKIKIKIVSIECSIL